MSIVNHPAPARVLHGRDQEQRDLTTLLDQARTGRSGAVVLRGEPGIGKTALLDYASGQATGFTVLHTRGVASETDLAFAGLHRLLRPVMDQVAALPHQQRQALAGSLELGESTERDRFLLSVAVLSLLSEVARGGPVLACVDDCHWLDMPTLDALSFAARRLDNEGVVMLFATRDQPAAGAPSRDPLEEIPVIGLASLDDTAIGGVLTDACDQPLGDEVRGPLVRVAGGNPLAAVELAASLSADQLAGRTALPEPLPPSEGLRQAYAARVAALPDDTQRLLLILALDEKPGEVRDDRSEEKRDGTREEAPDTTRAYQPDVTSLLIAAQHVGIDIAAIQPAEDAGLVCTRGGNIQFRHSLISAAVRHRAGPAERHTAHRLLADAYAELGDQQRRIWHRAATTLRPDATLAAQLEETAARARNRSGYGTASSLFERAAELTPAGTSQATRLHSAARDAWLAGEAHRARTLAAKVRTLPSTDEISGRTDLLLGSIELRVGVPLDAYVALRAAGERLVHEHRDLAVRTFLQAGEACDLAGDHARYLATARRVGALRQADESPETQIIFDYMEGKAANYRGDYAASLAPLRRVQGQATALGDSDSLVYGLVASHLLGDEFRAHKFAAEAVTVARSRGAVTTVPQALEFQSYTAFWTSRYPLNATSSLEGLQLARETGQQNCVSHHLAALAMIAAIRGDEEDCQRHAVPALEDADDHGLGLSGSLVRWALAFLDLTHGRYAESATRLRALAHGGPGRAHLVVRGISTPHFVEAAVRTGQTERARQALDAYRRWAETADSASALALVARCEALLRDGAEAEEYFAEALRRHEQDRRDFDYAHTLLLYGSFLRRSRKPTAAREHLYNSLESFQRLNAHAWSERATSELRSAGEVVRPQETPTLDQLSPQQLQIARFVAQGATNREVAAQLFLSPRTVDHHLRNIFAKLGIRSRVELARLFG